MGGGGGGAMKLLRGRSSPSISLSTTLDMCATLLLIEHGAIELFDSIQ